MNARGRFWLVAALIVVGLLIAFYRQIEWVDREVDTGAGEEARRNDFYAAELFLREHGVQTETVTGMALLDDLPRSEDLLFLTASRESLSERRRAALVEWVKSGGELLVVAHALYDATTDSSGDPLLDDLGIFLLAPEEEDDDAVDGAEDETTDETADDTTDNATDDTKDNATDNTGDDTKGDAPANADEGALDLESLPRTIADLLDEATTREACRESAEELTEVTTASGTRLVLELASENGLAVYNERLDDAYFASGAQLVSLPLGEGLVTALTSSEPLVNWRIHCQDHAFFLWLAAGDRDKVWLLHDPDVPSLATLAWTKLPGTVAGGLMLVLLTGAAASLRFGVPNAEEEAPRRELLEHLEASVTFHYRKGGFAALFMRLRNDLLRRGAPDRERWAERAGVTPAQAAGALVEAVPWNRREILRRVQTMLRMRRTK